MSVYLVILLVIAAAGAANDIRLANWAGMALFGGMAALSATLLLRAVLGRRPAPVRRGLE